MRKLIECGERTVQKMGRISIADIMKTHEIEPGDVVVVDVKLLYSGEDLENTDLSTKACVMNNMRSVKIVERELKELFDDVSPSKDQKRQIKSINEYLDLMGRGLKLYFTISDADFKAYCKEQDGEDEDEDEGDSE